MNIEAEYNARQTADIEDVSSKFILRCSIPKSE